MKNISVQQPSTQLDSMSIQNKPSKTKRNSSTCRKRRLQYSHKRRGNNHNKSRYSVIMKGTYSISEANLAAFPRIVWDDDSDDSSSLDDFGSSTSSLDDYLMKKWCSVENSEYVNDSLNRLEGMSLEHHHLHRSMAFSDLDSLGVSLSASTPQG
jgi:hypothetical protein